jgi:hypothetical protein
MTLVHPGFAATTIATDAEKSDARMASTLKSKPEVLGPRRGIPKSIASSSVALAVLPGEDVSTGSGATGAADAGATLATGAATGEVDDAAGGDAVATLAATEAPGGGSSGRGPVAAGA